MTSSWIALVAVRWVHLLGAAGLFGMSLFSIYAPQDVRRFCAADRPMSAMLVALAIAAFGSTLVWAVVTLASMSGDGIVSALDFRAWRMFVSETTFGTAWALSAVLALANIIVALSARTQSRLAVLAGSSALLLISHAWLGHAAALDGATRLGVTLAYALHVLGAGAWFGGLLSLVVVLSSARRPGAAEFCDVGALLERFSAIGLAAVAAIITGGVINAAAYAPSDVGAFFLSSWGRALIVKVALVVLMLVLACLNRFVLMPRLQADEPSGRRALARSVLAETILGVGVLAMTAALGVVDPGA